MDEQETTLTFMIVAQEKIFQEVQGAAKKAWPFKIQNGNKTLAILVHGFTGTPYDLWILADFLAENQMDIEVPLLPGHGGSMAMLLQANEKDWYQAFCQVVKDNVGKYDKIFLVGYSFGANLALQATLEIPGITGIVSLGIPIIMRSEKNIRLLLPLVKIFNKPYKKSWVNGEEASAEEFGRHNYIPISNLVSFYHFIDVYTKKNLAQVTNPVLVIHSRDDVISNPLSSEYLFEHLTGTKDKHLFILNHNDHNPVDTTRRDFIFTKTLQFIKSH